MTTAQTIIEKCAFEPKRTLSYSVAEVCLLPRQPYTAEFIQNRPSIGFAFEPQAGEHAIGTEHRTHFFTRPNSLAFVPAGCDIYSHSAEGGEYLKVTLSSHTGKLLACSQHFNNITDSRSLRAAHELRRMILGSETPDAFYLESRVAQLLRVTQETLHITPTTEPKEQNLSSARLKLVDEVIEEYLDQHLTVAELASHCQLSTAYFARAFKKSTGQSPHDYVLDRRISRARSLMRTSKMNLIDIALATGFSSHAHMTSVFQSRLGVTPSTIRHAIS